MRVPEHFHQDHRDKEIEARVLEIGDTKSLKQISFLETGLRNGWGERQFQNYLGKHPHLLVGRYRTGHGTYALFEPQLGSQYRVDWAVASGSSGGPSWELIELETPQGLPFRKNGHLSAATRRGVEQLQDWRIWLRANVGYGRGRSSGFRKGSVPPQCCETLLTTDLAAAGVS